MKNFKSSLGTGSYQLDDEEIHWTINLLICLKKILKRREEGGRKISTREVDPPLTKGAISILMAMVRWAADLNGRQLHPHTPSSGWPSYKLEHPTRPPFLSCLRTPRGRLN